MFLFGTQFTAADISAAVLFYRLETMGVSARYYSAEIRPVIFSYRSRMLERSSVKRTMMLAESMDEKHVATPKYSFGKTVFKVALVVGVIACGYFGYKQLSKRGLLNFWQ